MLLKEYIARFIKNFGGDNTFGIIGTPNVPLFDYLNRELKVVQNINENNCVYSAIGGYLSIKKIHFVVVTSGVGVTSLISALTDAYLNNIPVFLISTNSNTKYYGLGNHHDSSTLDDGIDTVGLTKNCTCFSILGSNVNSISKLFLKAYNYALEHKKPVHISISKNLFDEEMKDFSFPNILSSELSYNNFSISKEIVDILNSSSFPLFITSDSINEDIFLSCVDKHNIVFLNSLSNVSFGNQSDFYLGTYEYVKNDLYNRLLDKFDLIVFYGNKLDKYFIDIDYKKLSNKKIIHISNNNLDKSYLFGDNYYFININGDLFLESLLSLGLKQYYNKDFINKYKSVINLNYKNEYKNNLFVNFIEKINNELSANGSIFVDVGSVLNYSALFLSPLKKTYVNFPSSFFNMGSSYKSIGYSFYNKNNNFIFIGDGSFYMNLGEIITAIEYNLNINFVILNNNGYSSPLYMKFGQNIGKDEFCKYNKPIDFSIFSKSLNINYIFIDNNLDIEKLDINFLIGVNIIEIKTTLNSKMPL